MPHKPHMHTHRVYHILHTSPPHTHTYTFSDRGILFKCPNFSSFCWISNPEATLIYILIMEFFNLIILISTLLAPPKDFCNHLQDFTFLFKLKFTLPSISHKFLKFSSSYLCGIKGKAVEMLFPLKHKLSVVDAIALLLSCKTI